MNGIALTVLLSQIPKLFGFSVEVTGPLRQAAAIVTQVLAGRTNAVALAIGAGTLALILLLKRYPRVPGVLIAVVAATAVVGVLDLGTRAGVSVLGPLPQGLPKATVPFLQLADLQLADLAQVLVGGAAVALVSFADTSVLSRTYAARLRTPVDPNQEMAGLGLANLAAGFFQGFPISSSSSRTPVAEAAGSRTQLTGVVGAIAIAAAAGARATATPASAQHGAGGRGHRRGHRPVRDRGPAPHLSHPAMGVLALDGLLSSESPSSGRFPASRSRSSSR